jgi:hypothetical protein
MNKGLVGAAGALIFAIGFAASAQAAEFMVDPSVDTNALKLKLTEAKYPTSTTGNVDSVTPPSDKVNVSTDVSAEFASGWSTIKPHDDTLKTITLDPVDDTVFNGFSFRGQDLKANQDIVLTVYDETGVYSETFTFNVPTKNQDFARVGIIATGSDTISKIVLYNSGGWKEGKQYEFKALTGVNGTGGPTPEPAAWIIMIAGFGLLGTMLRRRTGTMELAAA